MNDQEYACDAVATARSMAASGYTAYEAADPRTYGVAEAIAYLREERERARNAFQRRFDAPAAPRPCSALEALHTGAWSAFFDACCAPSDAPF